MIPSLTAFRNIVQPYKAICFDSYGVLKNYNGLIEGAETTWRELAGMGKEIIILTNDASRPPSELEASYHRAGLKVVQAEGIVSSGMMAHAYLELKIKQGKVAYLGTKASAHYLEDLGLTAVPIGEVDLNEAEEFSALVLLDDEGFDWNRDINQALNLIRQQHISVVVANSDVTYPVSKRSVNIAIGGLGNMLETITGRQFIRFGKPDAQIFDFAMDKLLANSPMLKRDEVLMVGDTLRTDILGGNKYGFDTALVLTGNTSIRRYEQKILSSAIFPDHICPSVGWNDHP